MFSWNYLPVCHPHPSSIAYGKMPFIAVSFHCWASPSFIMNFTHLQMWHGISIVSAWGKNHGNENHCWLGIHIHINTHSLATEVQQEKVRRSNSLLLEWDVTSTQNTSGHSMNNLSAGNTVHAIAINRISCLKRLHSLHSTFDKALSLELMRSWT